MPSAQHATAKRAGSKVLKVNLHHFIPVACSAFQRWMVTDTWDGAFLPTVTLGHNSDTWTKRIIPPAEAHLFHYGFYSSVERQWDKFCFSCFHAGSLSLLPLTDVTNCNRRWKNNNKRKDVGPPVIIMWPCVAFHRSGTPVPCLMSLFTLRQQLILSSSSCLIILI